MTYLVEIDPCVLIGRNRLRDLVRELCLLLDLRHRLVDLVD